MKTFRSLKTRILLAFLAVTTAAVAVSFWAVERHAAREAEARLEAGLAQADALLLRTLERRHGELAALARMLGADPAFRAAARERGAALAAAMNHRERLGVHRLLVVDADGRVAADTLRVGAHGENLAENPQAARALAGGESGGFWMHDGRIFQVFCAPVPGAGALGAGFLVDEALAAELKRQTGAEVSFFSGGTLVASTLGPPMREALQTDFVVPNDPAGASARSGRRALRDERFVERLGRLGASGEYYLLQRSLDRERQPQSGLRRTLLFAGLAAISFAGLAGFLLARGIARPVGEIERGTRLVADGRYDVRLGVARGDELGRLAASFNAMVKGLQERERVRATMNKVVSREIAEELLKGEIKMGGEIRFATVLFSDIRGFTGISESLDPQQLIGFLNEYLTLMSRIVEKNHGVIDKYIGDAVMALFGAPVSRPGDVDNSLQAALEMLWALNDFNYRRAWEGKPKVTIGLGVNTGPVVAGNMGSEDRLNYTVLGDSVNLASRLEGLTRIYGVNCLVSEFTQRECKRPFIFRELDLVRVKGRSTAVRIYELWDGDQTKEGVSETLQKFQNARQFYLLKDWARAETLFRQVLEIRPEDGPSKLYLARIQQLMRTPPPETWDGVFTAVTK